MARIRRVNLSGMTGRGLAAARFKLSEQARQFGSSQEMAVHEAKQAGTPLPPWKRYQTPMEHMSSDSQMFTYELVDNYSSHNTLRKQGELTYWWLRAPNGVLPNQPGYEKPQEDVTLPVAQPAPVDLDQAAKDELVQVVIEALQAGRLQTGSPEWEIAHRIRTALTCGKPATEALPLHLAGGNRAEAHRQVLILKQYLPEAGRLAEVV